MASCTLHTQQLCQDLVERHLASSSYSCCMYCKAYAAVLRFMCVCVCMQHFGLTNHPLSFLTLFLPLASFPHSLLHVLAVTESSSAKECLQQMGFVDSLVHVICSHQLVSQPTTTSDRSGADSSSSAATGDEQASHGSSDAHSASHGSSHAASASPSSKPVVRLPDGLDSWRFMCAAALLRPILAPLQAMRCSQHCSQQGVSGSISSVGVTADGSAVRTQHENSSNSIGSTAGSNGEVAEGCEAQSQGMGVSVYAVCIYGLLLPLQVCEVVRSYVCVLCLSVWMQGTRVHEHLSIYLAHELTGCCAL